MELNNSGKDRIKWDDIDHYRLIFSKEMIDYFFYDTPIFFDLNAVNDVYQRLGAKGTINFFKEYVRNETLIAYGKDHPEIGKKLENEIILEEKMTEAAKLWDNF